jgi:uncharacterized delta-60 repeat protein
MRAHLSLLVAWCALVAACGSTASPAADQGVESSRPADLRAADARPSLSIALKPAKLVVRQGRSATVAVTLTRTAWSGSVTISAQGLPAGVTAPPVTISADQASLVLSATAQAELKLATATVGASGGGLDASAALVVDVRRPEGADTTFGAAGSVRFEIPQQLDPYVLAIQPDGKILVSALTSVTQPLYKVTFVVYRFLSSGAPDTSFGASGAAVVGDPGMTGLAPMALQGDGKIVAAYMSSKQVAVRRLQGDGAADASFGVQGLVTIALDGSDAPFGVALQPDGKIVVVGQTRPSPLASSATLFILRLLPDGQLDSTFGTGGKVKHLLNAPWAVGEGVLVDGGAIYVRGSVDTTNQQQIIARFTASGTLDPSFGTSGVLVRSGRIVSLHAAPAGVTFVGSASSPYVARLTGAGALDPTFGKSGVADAPAATGVRYADLAIEPVERILWGRSRDGAQGSLELVALSAAGELEQGFGGGGALALGFTEQVQIRTIARAPDGRIVALGRATATSLVLARFYP